MAQVCSGLRKQNATRIFVSIMCSKMPVHTDKYYMNVIANAQLSDTSKKGYSHRFKTMKKIAPGKSLHQMLTHPEHTFEIISENYSEPHSVKALVNSMLTIFRHAPGLRTAEEDSYKEWRKIFDVVHAEAEKRYQTNTPSTRQQQAYVPWKQVIATRECLPRGSLEYLWLCCHTMIPPMRADLDRIHIVDKEPSANQLQDVANYLLWKPQKSPKEMELVLHEFKTSGMSGNRARTRVYRKVLPQELVSVITNSLQAQPRKFLIISPRTKQPFLSPQTYINWVNRMLGRIFKPCNMTISLLRHSFVTSLDHNALQSGEKEALARDLMHSPAMFDRYRIIMNAPKCQQH